jgi:hypothetical protein
MQVKNCQYFNESSEELEKLNGAPPTTADTIVRTVVDMAVFRLDK